MMRPRPMDWLAAVAAIAATYFYFLLFAEFAFLELAREVSPDSGSLRVIMVVLGGAGISGGVIAARIFRESIAPAMLAWSFRGSAAGALLGLLSTSMPALALAAAVSGAALGMLTVALAATLRERLGNARLGLGIGIGTGLAYAICNLPWVFQASPAAQTSGAAVVVFAASFLPRWSSGTERPQPAQASPALNYARWITVLLALVWLDSAAFYIIQHSTPLRSETWTASATLLANATTHLVVAIVAGMLLDRGFRRRVIGAALVALAVAALSLNGTLPIHGGANWLYTAGVSLYSVALVEVPARSGRAAVAAVVFGLCGWIGSALGIGMAQDLARIPTWFIATASGVALAAWRPWRRKAGLATCGLALVAAARADEVALGREVYIAEGCIHCHSQYLRPKVASEIVNWGPGRSLGQTLSGQPPLIGTRRQGPDLSHVGNRRSPEWNRLHLMSPQAVSPGSRMPSYPHLFAPGDTRGEALVAYLASLGADSVDERRDQIAQWQPPPGPPIAAPAAARLFGRLCSPCHGADGRGDGPAAAKLQTRPTDWSRDLWRHAHDPARREADVCRIIKFGLPGLPMAGHEYLPDGEILGLARHVLMLHEQNARGVATVTRP